MVTVGRERGCCEPQQPLFCFVVEAFLKKGPPPHPLSKLLMKSIEECSQNNLSLRRQAKFHTAGISFADSGYFTRRRRISLFNRPAAIEPYASLRDGSKEPAGRIARAANFAVGEGLAPPAVSPFSVGADSISARHLFCNLTTGFSFDRLFGRSKPLPYRKPIGIFCPNILITSPSGETSRRRRTSLYNRRGRLTPMPPSGREGDHEVVEGASG